MGLRGDKILRAMFFTDREPRHVCPRRGKRVENIAFAEDVTEIQSVLRRQIVVQARAELIVVGCFRLGLNESGRTVVGLRIEAEQILGNGIYRGKLIIRIGLAGKKVDELMIGIVAEARAKTFRADVRKIAFPFRQAGNGSLGCFACAFA